MNIGIAIWPKEEAEWIDLCLDSIEDVHCFHFESLGGEIENLLSLDLIIIDPDRPGAHFIEHYETLVSRGGALPLAILGTNTHPILKQIAWKKNATLFIPKPYKFDELQKKLDYMVEKLRSYLQRKTPSPKHNSTSVNKGRAPQNGLSSLDPKDVIQMLCLSQWSGRIDVYTAEAETGSIYLQQGQMKHAITRGMDGEEACFAILNWSNCEFSFIEDSQCLLESVGGHWEGILLEASRRQDEEQYRHYRSTGT